VLKVPGMTTSTNQSPSISTTTAWPASWTATEFDAFDIP
jgi:hypothetical protein